MSPNGDQHEFEQARAAAAEAARHAEDARLSAFQSTEQVRREKAAGGAPSDSAQRIARERLTEAKQARLAYDARREVFLDYSDPRVNAAMLNDRTPIVLFPVRIETRFGWVDTGAGPAMPQLWVRVYPDDCVIDTFEPLPSENEIASAQRYWALTWRARGNEGLERAAWRQLVASHGSGRAAWLDANYQPTNAAQKPGAGAANTLVLVIPTETPLTGQELTAVGDYWAAIWKADGDRTATDAAATTLRGAAGSDARTQELIDSYKPVNLVDKPPGQLTRAATVVSTVFVEFPKTEDLPARLQAWSQPARVRVLPERLVLIGYAGGAKVVEAIGEAIPWPLTVGPDPLAAPGDQIRQESGEVVMSDDLKWLTDFDRAVEVGMGFRVDLSSTVAASGLDRLLVVGLRMSADAAEGKRLIEELLAHHRDGSSGLSILRQGTPTNNTEEGASGHSRSDDADASFDARHHGSAPLRSGAPWRAKLDGEWLAEALGVDVQLFDGVGGSRGTDQLEAQSMNTALWPATIGYYLETMMHPLLDADDVDGVRWFFEHLVSGRGLLPVVRIGRQPYGVLTTGVVSRMAWHGKDLAPIAGLESPAGFRNAIAHIYEVVRAMSGDWKFLSDRVSRVGKPGVIDSHQQLLDILALHPTSVEFSQRYAESVDDLYNRLRSYGWGTEFMAAIAASSYAEGGMELLTRLGYGGDARPDVLEKLFLEAAEPLKGPFIEEAPVSETGALHASTPVPSNYIEWLLASARTSLDALRTEAGFNGNKPPKAILYLLLRHALLQSYWDSSLLLNEATGVMDASTVKVARREPSFVHVQGGATTSESRWNYLYTTNAQVTGNAAQRVGDYITASIGTNTATSRLSRMLEALEILKDVPTARLERLLAEHLDTCSYRLDAWQQALLYYALATMRYSGGAAGGTLAVVGTHGGAGGAGGTVGGPPRQGVYLGAFGWLEDVRPRNRQLTPQPPVPGLDASFHDANLPPLMRDSANGGYVHAPSQNQAVAAAVLRSGYLANATSANPQTLAVNLSSRRVRRAMSILEGVRQGQSLGALLGYQFERGLHDNYAIADVDQFIYPLRKQFPLVADRHPDTSTAEDVPIEAIEARNVVDGLRLVNFVKDRPSRAYPFGLNLPTATPDEAKAIDAEVDRLLDATDAVADLKLADSVYHAVQGNYDRVAATLDSSGSGQLPTDPDIVRTPRTGRTISHRVALHLESGLDEDISPILGLRITPRARAEPAVNNWLASLLPEPAEIACTVTYFDLPLNRLTDRVVTLAELELQPIDLLYIASLENDQAMTELDDRVVSYAHEHFVARPDCAVTIAYQTPVQNLFTFFQVAPLIRSLRPLLLQSRPLRPTDAMPEGTARAAMDAAVAGNRDRIVKVRDELASLRDDLVTLRDSIAALHEPAVQRAAIVADVDNQLDDCASALDRAATFAIPQSGWGFVADFRRTYVTALLDDVREAVKRWQPRLTACNALLATYDGATTLGNDELFGILVRAEQQVRVRVAVPAPTTLAAYRLALGTARDEFSDRLTAFENCLTLASQSIVALRTAVVNAVSAAPPIETQDLTPPNPEKLDDSIVRTSSEILGRCRRLVKAIEDTRLTPADAQIGQHDAAAGGAARAQLLIDAAKTLLGSDAVFVPEFQLDDANALAMQTAYDAGVAGDPLDYQLTVRQTPLPVDTWLYGAARVREKLQHWETMTMLGGALSDVEPELVPLQMPWKTGEHWLGLEYPSGYVPDGDRLCYTAHFAEPFDQTRPACGLLIDEWTEVIPATEETTGLTFHFDRPNAEAPQTLLVVTPPAFIGAWQWEDIVDAVGETLDRARQRAVEPVHVDDTLYPRFLPMTMMATTLYEISIATNLARNNDVYTYIAAAPATNG